MKSGKTLTMIMVISLMLWNHYTYAQTAGELLPKAIQLEEVKGDLDEAIKTYQMILNKFPDDRGVCAEALLHLGMCYEKLGLDQARQTYRDVISKYSEQADKIAMARDRISRLDAYNAELIAKAEEHFKKGNELFKRWEYELAIKEYENVISSGPNTEMALNARYCIGQSWFRAGKYDNALVTFTKLIEENPKSTIAPVSELMAAQVRHSMENEKNQSVKSTFPGRDTITDPETGITFRKIKIFTGESDVITYINQLNLSPNGKFLLDGNKVVPMDNTAPFELIDAKSKGFIPTRSIWSQNGMKVAFYSGDALCVIPVSPETGHATGPFLKIVKAELDHEPLPGWSPDGSSIVYYYDWKMWTVNPDGSDLKKIKDNKSHEVGPVWSPDGKTIAFGSGEKSLMLYNVENNQFSEFAITGQRSYPVWSPDGKWILDKAIGLHFYNLADKTEFKFPLLKGIGGFFSWRADGNKLLFYASSYKSDMFLRIAPANGGPSYEPVPRLSSEDITWWRNDSKSLAVFGVDENGNFAIRITPLSGSRSDIIHLDGIPGSKPSPLNITSDFGQVVFSVGLDNGNKNIYIAAVSAEEAKTTGPPLKLFEKNWKERTYYYFSADGKNMAFVRDSNIWIANTNGDEPILASDFKGEVEYLRWTNDGKSLLFPTSSDPISSGWNLMVNPGPKSKIIKLMDEGKEITCRHWNIAISPDNSKIAVLTDQQIKIIPVDGTKTGRILNIGNLELKGCVELNWSPDGKSLAFIGGKEMDDKVSFPDGKFLIYNIPADGGLPVRVAPEDDDIKCFLSWSPDSKWIAYSSVNTLKVRPESTIWEADFEEVLEKLAK